MGKRKNGPRWICLGVGRTLKAMPGTLSTILEGKREPVKGLEQKSNGVALTFKENHSSAGGVRAKEME